MDFKAYYSGSIVDQPPDPALYQRVARAFPSAWIEDPALTPETDAVLANDRERFSWDAPIHSIADIEALTYPLGWSTSSRLASAVCRACWTRSTTAPSGGSATTAGASSSSESGAARSSTSPRCSTRMRPTTSPQPASTSPSPPRAALQPARARTRAARLPVGAGARALISARAPAARNFHPGRLFARSEAANTSAKGKQWHVQALTSYSRFEPCLFGSWAPQRAMPRWR